MQGLAHKSLQQIDNDDDDDHDDDDDDDDDDKSLTVSSFLARGFNMGTKNLERL